MTSHADVRDMIAPYALGALDQPETMRIEEHLSECAFCANLAREATEVAHYLCYAAPARPAPAGSIDRLLASIDTRSVPLPSQRERLSEANSAPRPPQRDSIVQGSAHPRSRPAWRQWLRSPAFLPVAACLILALSLAGWNASLMGELHSEHSEMNQLQQRLVEQSRLLVMVTSNSSVTRPLQGTALAPSAQVRLIMDGESNSAMLMASELPPLPPNRIYQVWLGRQGARMPAGKLTVDQHGDGECNLRLDSSVHSYDTAWITIEPSQGGPMPNAPGVARGKL